eukprot:Gregarina_sp_Poly_1__6964@NODE_378_length_9084_cov_115_952201_g311_i0_p10_GENE_NODE_378_length_9084_cov_115_952201_g311_i0NODE_378_length_9084_cov_115_952201_g311_i0_p10_ORF_typecomplete_len101_score2_77Nup88/PF10168_9/0_033_NODE_378_length_9084_cov_115_952201_g311_i034113713
MPDLPTFKCKLRFLVNGIFLIDSRRLAKKSLSNKFAYFQKVYSTQQRVVRECTRGSENNSDKSRFMKERMGRQRMGQTSSKHQFSRVLGQSHPRWKNRKT